MVTTGREGARANDIEFSDISAHSSCGPSSAAVESGSLSRWEGDLEGELRDGQPLDLVVRVTRIEAYGGPALGSPLTQQPGPEGRFRFRKLPKGIYRLEVLHEGQALGVEAHTGYSCACGSPREVSAEIAHESNSTKWKVKIGVRLDVEVYDAETGAPIPFPYVGHRMGDAQGRASIWRNVVADPRTLGEVSAPGYARSPLPNGGSYQRPGPPQKVELQRESPLEVRFQDERGEPIYLKRHFVYVHQSLDPCPAASSPEAECLGGAPAHGWTKSVNKASRVSVRHLPPTKGTRLLCLLGRRIRAWTVIPGDQRLVVVTLPTSSDSPTFSRE